MTDDTTTTTPPTKKPRKRSPNFPGISLEKAVERAGEVERAVQQYPAPVTKIAVDYWGYNSPNTGPAAVTYAALKRYGLLADEGQGDGRVARLTDLAVQILHKNPDQDSAKRTAALSPEIFRDWWGKYRADLPPDDALHWEYVVKGPFAKDGFQGFLRAYRETIAYAKLTDGDSVGDDGNEPDPDPEDQDDDQDDDQVDDQNGGGAGGGHRNRGRRDDQKPGVGVVTISLPLPSFEADEPVVIEFPGKITDEDWEFFTAMIAGLRGGVVKKPGEQANPA